MVGLNCLKYLVSSRDVTIRMLQVSIILPVYNSEHYLNSTLVSILQQTMPDFELIAINDCSTDQRLQILQNWAQRDNRIQIAANEQNIGVADTRNKGITMAKGEYICFVDSDDTWHSEKLECQLNFMKQSCCDFSCTAYARVDDEGKFMKNRFINKQQIVLEDLLKENYICCSTVMLKTELAKQYSMNGSYAHEDYVYWLDLLQNGANGMVLDETLVQYRVAQSGRSADKGKAAQGRWQIYRKHLHYGVVKSARYFMHYAINGIKKYL